MNSEEGSKLEANIFLFNFVASKGFPSTPINTLSNRLISLIHGAVEEVFQAKANFLFVLN